MFDGGKRVDTGDSLVDPERHASQHLGECLQGKRVVVHDKETPIPEVCVRQIVAGLGLAAAQPRGEEKRTALTWPAFDADLAAHQLGKPLADRQPETGPAVLARGGSVGL